MNIKPMLLLWFSSIILLSGCGSKTVGFTGPAFNAGPVSLSAYINTDGEVTLNGIYSLGAPVNVGPSWDVGFQTTLNQAESKKYTLFILYSDSNGNINQQECDVNQPFDIKFDQTQWVEDIKTDGNGNIIVSVKPNPLSAAFPAGNDAPATSAPIIKSSPPTTAPETSLLNPTPYPILGRPCSDAPATRVAVGDLATVTTTNSDPLFLRSAPVVGNNLVTKLYAGMKLRVLDGPRCSNNFVYWHVQMADASYTGWAAEGDNNLYFLAPVY